MSDRLIAEAGRENTIIINAGNNFRPGGEVEIKKAAVIFKAFAMMGVDFIGLGPTEFVFGYPFLKNLAAGSTLNSVCANLEEAGPVSRYPVPYLQLHKGGKKVLVTSVIDPRLLKLCAEKIILTDPVSAIKKAQKAVVHDLFIVVCHTDFDTAKKWLARVRGIDLAILGHQPGVGQKKLEINGAEVVVNNDRSQFVSHIDLVPRDGAYAISEPQNIKLRVGEIEEDLSIAGLINKFEAWSRKYHYKKTRNRVLGKVRLHPENKYVGKDRCLECHDQTVTSWAETAHARALDSLIKKGKEYDPQCLPCHVTGMKQGEAGGGFVSIDSTPHMANVQCEACHGPAGMHVLDSNNVFDQLPGEQTCLQCHTKETDPDFDYRKKRHKGIHE